jgi:DNA-binding protein H-NS
MKSEIEEKIKSLEEVLPTANKEELDRKTNELSETLAKYGDQLYKKEEPKNEQGGNDTKPNNSNEPMEGEIVS